MPSLGAKQAAVIANEVYAVRDNDIKKAMKLSQSGLGIEGEFTIADGGRIQGESGPLIFRTKTGFGYVAEGEGKRQGEVLIATRGTVPGLQDIATDLNIGLQKGPGGWPVHAGFNDTFNSYKQQLQSYFNKRNPSHVHCVGHSLGGALSTLTADYLSEDKIAGVTLYTFGSPRVGAMGFSNKLTRKLQADNICRVYHSADPIGMIPIFPFSHVPASVSDILLDWNGGLISPAAHSMENYIRSVGDAGWQGLRRGSPEKNWGERAKKWLESASSEGVILFSAKSLWMITKALAWVIKKVLVGVVGTSLAVTATLLDQFAWLLRQGVMASVEIADYVKSLLGKILHFLGRATQVADLTVGFIRWVLSSLFSSLQNVARRSLDSLV